MEAALEPFPVTALAAVIAETVHVVNPPHRPSVDGRIEIAELPLVGGQLAVGVLELLEEEEPELVLGECGVDQREGHALECQVPSRKPRIFPLVGHRHHAQRVEMPPVAVADRQAAGGGRGGWIVSVEPFVHVEDVALLRPQQPCQRPPLHEPLVFRGLRWRDGRIEPLGLVLPRLDDRIDVVEGANPGRGAQPEMERGLPTRWHIE